jgi:hypothetical protein
MSTEDMTTDAVKERSARTGGSRTRSAPRLGARFTPQERRDLTALRDRYQQGRDLFSHSELTHLRFLRWLSRSGRLDA